MATPADFYKETTVLLTGATCEVGGEIARAFVAAGAKLVITGADTKYGIALARELNQVPAGSPELVKPKRTTPKPRRTEIGDMVTVSVGSPSGEKELGESTHKLSGDFVSRRQRAAELGEFTGHMTAKGSRRNTFKNAEYIHYDGIEQDGLQRALRAAHSSLGGLDIAVNIFRNTHASAAQRDVAIGQSLKHQAASLVKARNAKTNKQHAVGKTILNVFASGADTALKERVEESARTADGQDIFVSTFNAETACGKNAAPQDLAQAILWSIFEESQSFGDQLIQRAA